MTHRWRPGAVEVKVDQFEFDVVDEPTRRDVPHKKGPRDTRALRIRRCDVCGVPMYFEEHEEPSHRCPNCQVKTAAAVADLLLRRDRATVNGGTARA
jgi:hypothetical protein